MGNPYAQVALTYFRRVGSCGVTGWATAVMMCVAIVLLGTVVARSGIEHSTILLLIVIFPGLNLWQMIVAHATEQFADSRAHLMPNFRRPHLAAVALLGFSVVFLIPATFTWLAGVPSICLVAVTAFFCGTALPQPRWLKTSMSALVFAFLFLVIALGRSGREQLVLGLLTPSWQLELVSLVILLLAGAMILQGTTRLARRDEASPDSPRRNQAGQTGRGRSAAQQNVGEWPGLGGVKEWLAERHALGLAEHAHRAKTSPWSRVCRWQAGMTTGWSIWFWSVGLVGIYQAWAWLALADPSGPFPLGILLAFFPFLNSVVRWNDRTPTLAYELLLPVTRSAYLRQLGAAAALNQLQVWAAMSAVAIACWPLFGRANQPFILLVNLLVLSGLSQIWLFGVAVWWTRCRSMIMGVLVVILGVAQPLLLIGLQAADPRAEWWYAAWFVAGLFALFGQMLLHNAYRRWWSTELDCVKI
jgi:hypothetical protein